MRLKSILFLGMSIVCTNAKAQSVQRLKAQLGTCSGILISPECVSKSSFINAVGEGIKEDNTKNSITSCDVIIIKKGLVYRTHMVGNEIDPDMHALLEQLKGNDGIYISNINSNPNESKKNYIYEPALQIVENKKDQDSITVYLHNISNTTSSIMGIKNNKEYHANVKGDITELLYTIGHETGTAMQRFYSNGVLKYEKVFYASGNLCMSLNYLSGTHLIVSEEYYPNGKMHRNGMFLSIPSLYERDNYNNGLDSFSQMNGYPIGYWNWYYPDGRPKMEGKFDTVKVSFEEILAVNEKSSTKKKNTKNEEYNDIVRDGIWKYYDEDGKLTRVTYKNGEIIKKE